MNDLLFRVFKNFTNREGFEDSWRYANEFINNRKIMPIAIKPHNIKLPFELPPNCYIGGGAANYWYAKCGRLKDIDIFIVASDAEDFNIARESIAANVTVDLYNVLYPPDNSGYKIKKHIVETYFTYSIKVGLDGEFAVVQVIKKFYKNPAEILSIFDLPCCKVLVDNKNFYYTCDYELCATTLSFGLNFKVNSVAYRQRVAKYGNFYEIIYADLKDKKVIKKEEFYEGESKPASYYVSRSNNAVAIITNKLNLLTITDGFIDIEVRSKRAAESVKYFIAKKFPEYNSLFLDIDAFIKKFAEYAGPIIEEEKIKIMNYINAEDIRCFSFGNRRDYKHPDEYYGAGKGIAHLNLPHMKFLDNWGFIIGCTRHIRKLPKYVWFMIIEYVFS